MVPKGHTLIDRFREVVSDPLNLLIERHEKAGFCEDGLVYLHNGLRVPVSGASAYSGEFSQILIINRGVHEPLEEYVFQELLKLLPAAPKMIELGAYWGHYSMWLKQRRPEATVLLVEPVSQFLQVGRANFEFNQFEGEFIQGSVGVGQLTVDGLLATKNWNHLEILHSDIQGAEIEMLVGAKDAIQQKKIDYIFVSTHGEDIHLSVCDSLSTAGYRLEASASFEHETTSYDGFIFASSPLVNSLFNETGFVGRTEINRMRPAALLAYVTNILAGSR